jgi:hypothetical protein
MAADRRRAAAQPALLLLLASAAQAQLPTPPPVEVEYEKSTDFSAFKTYAWVPFQERASRPGTHLRITGAVERELGAKGLQKAADAGRADVYVEYQGHREKKVRGTPSKEASVWQPSQPRFTVDFSKVEVGTLVIRLWAGANRDVVWSARGQAQIPNPAAEERIINEVVKRLLAPYPPEAQPQPTPPAQ